MLGFFIIGVYVLATTNFYSDNNNNTVDTSSNFEIDNGYMAGTIIGMLVLSILIAIIFVLLLKKFPACMVYGMIALIFIVLIAVIILGFVVSNYWLSIICVVILLFLALFLFCYREKLKLGILLLEVAADFITEKPTVYIAPLYPLIMSLLFCLFWVFSFIAIFNDKN